MTKRKPKTLKQRLRLAWVDFADGIVSREPKYVFGLFAVIIVAVWLIFGK